MMAATKKPHLKKKRSDPNPNPNPNPVRTRPDPEPRRSLRPRQTRYLADLEDEQDLDEEEIEREARERSRLKVAVRLPPSSSPLTAPRSRKVELVRHVAAPPDDTSDEELDVKPLKKRRFGEEDEIEDGSGHREGSKRNVIRRTIRAASGTPMPDKIDLEAVLDKLQKKDTYGVFAEPVDPEELPDYHDVIEHPMDFGTVRRKLASGRYRTFEQFEDDVFLICSNAMQYNAPDTIYFRQAHSIQDMARRNFQEIRADLIPNGAKRNYEENIRSTSPEEKILKRVSCFNPSSIEKKTRWHPHNRSALKPLVSDLSSVENKTLKKQFQTPLSNSVKSSFERKIMKKPQYKTLPNTSSTENKAIENPRDTSKFESLKSDVSSLDKITVNKTQYKNPLKPPASDISSIEKNTIKMVKHRNPCSDISSAEKMTVQRAQYVTESESSDSERSTPEDSEPLDLDTASMEKTSPKEPYCSRDEPEPFELEICSQDKKKVRDPLCSDISSGATLASVADTFTDLSKTPGDDTLTTVKSSALERSVPINGLSDGISVDESKSEKADDISAKCSPTKFGLKPFIVDMNRRATYNALEEQPSIDTDSIFNVFEDAKKELISVVPHDSEYSYARSLARFAGPLGPIAWDIASKKIEQVLPPGAKFGPGWVGEFEPLLTPVLYSKIKEKANEMKNMGAISVKSKKNKGNVLMASNRILNHIDEGRERTRDPKPGLFGFNLDQQPSSVKQNLQPQKNQPKPTIPATISQGWNQVQNNVQKPQQQKNQMLQSKAEPLTKIYTNEATRHRPELLYPEAPSQIINNNGLSINIGGSNGWRSTASNRLNSHFGIDSNHQAVAQYWLPQSSHEQAINDPLRMTSSNPNNIINCSSPIVQNSKCENLSFVSTAQAWKNPNSASRVYEGMKVKPESLLGFPDNSQLRPKGVVMFPQLMTNSNLSMLHSPWQGLMPHNKKKDSLPPDLNISFQPPESPARSSSSIHIDAQQPDLALQL